MGRDLTQGKPSAVGIRATRKKAFTTIEGREFARRLAKRLWVAPATRMRLTHMSLGVVDASVSYGKKTPKLAKTLVSLISQLGALAMVI